MEIGCAQPLVHRGNTISCLKMVVTLLWSNSETQCSQCLQRVPALPYILPQVILGNSGVTTFTGVWVCFITVSCMVFPIEIWVSCMCKTMDNVNSQQKVQQQEWPLISRRLMQFLCLHNQSLWCQRGMGWAKKWKYKAQEKHCLWKSRPTEAEELHQLWCSTVQFDVDAPSQ